jgi:acyl-CoA reductase-like NAD-dependent aldehyde dehydrogenase
MSITEHALRNLVAGDLVDAVEGGVREVVNPATGDVIAEVPEGSQADGGFKESGYGKDMSVYSLEDYTQIKHVMAKLS